MITKYIVPHHEMKKNLPLVKSWWFTVTGHIVILQNISLLEIRNN